MNGRPAANLQIELVGLDPNGGGSLIAATRTGATGRTAEPLIMGDAFAAGSYELRFHVGEYFRDIAADVSEPPFLDVVPIRFQIADPQQRYHIPLLVTPWSYSTYRGS
jgi:5-hydroxyisourate hydrolase